MGARNAPLVDCQRRSLRGKVTKQDLFPAFAMKVRELLDRYGISLDPDQLIVSSALNSNEDPVSAKAGHLQRRVQRQGRLLG